VVGYLSELTGKAFDRDQLFARKEDLKAAACSTAPAMTGAFDRMREAKSLGWHIGVVSTSDAEWVSSHLQRVGLNIFPEILVTRENVKNVKPHPEPYLTAAAKLNVRPEHCVVFEDSLNGIKAAKAAGMFAVAVPNKVTSFLTFEEADRRIHSLAQIALRDLAGL
jgi:HAD superfamily hydrolase (TIGR01509 family)